MKPDIKNSIAANLLKQRNFSYSVCVFLMATNLFLLAKVWTKNDRIIVIPSMNEMEHQYHFDGKHIPDNYIVDWSFKLLGELFTANPKTVTYKNTQFLKWSLNTSGLAEDLGKSAKALKKDNISTAFYPESHSINRDLQEVQVEGRFLTFFGKSQKPVLTHKTFLMSWQLMPGGHMGIKSLKELKREK
ncbi:MAG: TraE/TraK family type IV conjugative transfer system protein [Proteobacteria bacterium]|nr:TraE/TraK family type IV conjugative transfer system protein [Pseudomonadota bacterium]